MNKYWATCKNASDNKNASGKNSSGKNVSDKNASRKKTANLSFFFHQDYCTCPPPLIILLKKFMAKKHLNP